MQFTIKHLFILCILIICCCSIGANTQFSPNAQNTAAHEGHDKASAAPYNNYQQSPMPINGDNFGVLLDENGNPYKNVTIFAPPSSKPNNDDRDITITYILVFTAVLLVIFIIFLVVGMKYKSKINGKLQRLEQVKDMQSLEASNMRPLTKISPTGRVEDKREGFSNHSSSNRNNQYPESISLQSSTTDGSQIENAYNYIGDLDYDNNVDYNGNIGYINQEQYMHNKNMGMNYMQPTLDMQSPPNYDGPYHSTPASFGINKSDLKNLYSTPNDPYDTDEGVIMKPQNALYDANGMISPIQNSSSAMSPYTTRNINNMGYDTDLAYNNYNYNDEQLMYDGERMNQMTSVTAIPQKAAISNYNQMRGDPRMKRRSHTELKQIPDRSPGLYAPRNMNGSPMLRKGAGSVISETRSAKSLLIDQMVHAMDIEAESDDTLSNYPINDDKSSVVGSVVNGKTRGSSGSVVGRSSNVGQYTKMTTTSSSASLNKMDTKAYSNQAANENGRNKMTNEDQLRKKKVKRESVGRRERNRDFHKPNLFSQESDSCYESNNSFNQSIYDEVKVFEVEEDEDLIINSSEEYCKYSKRK